MLDSSPFLWFAAPLLSTLFCVLLLDLIAYLRGKQTFSQAMQHLGEQKAWIKPLWLGGGFGLVAYLYLHFWRGW